MTVLDLSLTLQYSPQTTLAARQFLQTAVAYDPQSADAWAWLADLLASDYLNVWNDAGESELAQAETAAANALAIDPEHAVAHFARGFTLRARGKHRAALFAFDRAIRSDANFARAYAHKGAQFLNIGRPEDARPGLFLHRGLRLGDPLAAAGGRRAAQPQLLLALPDRRARPRGTNRRGRPGAGRFQGLQFRARHRDHRPGQHGRRERGKKPQCRSVRRRRPRQVPHRPRRRGRQKPVEEEVPCPQSPRRSRARARPPN